MQPKSICVFALATALTSCAGMPAGGAKGAQGAPPMPAGFYGHQQPTLSSSTVSRSAGPPMAANVQSGQPFAQGAPAGYAQGGYPQGGYTQNDQGQWVPTGASQAQGAYAPTQHNQGQSANPWNGNQGMPGSIFQNGQPVQTPPPVGWNSAPGGPTQAPGAPAGWGQPGVGAAVPGAYPEAHQQWPHGAQGQGSQALDPWSAKAPQGGSSSLVLPQAATAAGQAIGNAVGGLTDMVTGARSVPPGSTGLESRGVYDTDGGAARAQVLGAVGALEGPVRELEMSGSGRLYLLEMYQQALEDRDTLEMEVGTLTARLEQMQARAIELESQLTASESARAEVAREGEGLRAENQDLATRLVTAQIRRLEAEKMLIEARIEQERAAAPTGEVPGQNAAPRPPTAGPATAPTTATPNAASPSALGNAQSGPLRPR